MQQLQQVALDLFEALDTPVSLASAMLVKAAEWDQLALRGTDPNDYVDSQKYLRDAQSTAFLRKVEDLPTTLNRTQVAVEGWLKDEAACAAMNFRLQDGHPIWGAALCRICDGVKRKVLSLIGWAPPKHYDIAFGNGSTYEYSGILKLLPNKLTAKPSMTNDAWVFLSQWSGTAWGRSHISREVVYDPLLPRFLPGHPPYVVTPLSRECNITRGNRIWFVPKNGKTDRAIAIEPTLNLAYQLGLGRCLRKELRKRGLLLRNSQEIHRELARQASVTGALATLDLSSASDTVCYRLVQAVIPDHWFEELRAARSPYTNWGTQEDPKWVRLEKFSSMGNGATFELETVIFAAICLSVAEEQGVVLHPGKNFSVYGDDIIVPTEISGAVALRLQNLGFRLNEQKSFVSGPFRESCGGDFFSGTTVRPVFQDKIPTEPAELFSLHNRLVKASDTLGVDTAKARRRVLSYLPKHLRSVGGPRHYGDVVLHGIEPIVRVKGSIPKLKTVGRPRYSFSLRRWDEASAVATLLYVKNTGQSVSIDRVGARPEIDRPQTIEERQKDSPEGYVLEWVPYYPEPAPRG